MPKSYAGYGIGAGIGQALDKFGQAIMGKEIREEDRTDKFDFFQHQQDTIDQRIQDQIERDQDATELAEANKNLQMRKDIDFLRENVPEWAYGQAVEQRMATGQNPNLAQFDTEYKTEFYDPAVVNREDLPSWGGPGGNTRFNYIAQGKDPDEDIRWAIDIMNKSQNTAHPLTFTEALAVIKDGRAMMAGGGITKPPPDPKYAAWLTEKGLQDTPENKAAFDAEGGIGGLFSGESEYEGAYGAGVGNYLLDMGKVVAQPWMDIAKGAYNMFSPDATNVSQQTVFDDPKEAYDKWLGKLPDTQENRDDFEAQTGVKIK